MSVANPQSQPLPDKIDEILEMAEGEAVTATHLNPDGPTHALSHNTAKTALTKLLLEARISELEELLGFEDSAWVKREGLNSHEQFVHTNLIRNRTHTIKQHLKGSV